MEFQQPPGTGEGRAYFVRCPLCQWSHKLFKTGDSAIQKGKPVFTKKGWFRFNSGKMDLEVAPFIDIRDMTGGRGRGLRRIDGECLSLKEAIQDEKYKDLIQSLKNQIDNIHKILKAS